VQFVRNMGKLGYTGIFVPSEQANNGGDHIIVFNPKVIEVTKIEVLD